MATAPHLTGILTFAFTDIEGSTARWERDRPAMTGAVRRHDAIVRAAIDEHAGQIFKTIGDAFCSAFARPEDAVAAMLAMQRHLASEDFSSVDGLRVRAAIHSGSADARDGDYFGPAVNKVARLLALGHGAQVLLTHETATLVSGALPVGASLRELGAYHLKDFTGAQRVYQLLADGLAAEFPPLRSLGTLPSDSSIVDTAQLRPVPSFGGRDEELDAVHVALGGDGAIALLHGLGGVGKSSIAREYGWRNRDSYSVVWWLNAQNESGIIEGLLRLGAMFVQGLDQLADVRAAAQRVVNSVLAGFDKPVLLIFDNLEDEQLMRTWLPRTARALATSRDAAWSADITTIALQTWSPDTATEYLIGASGRTDLSRDQARAIAQSLGALPLALAHAAAALRGMRMITPQRYLERINEHLRNAPRGADYPRSVAATFSESIVQAEQQAPGAAALLCFVSHYAPDAIPDELFREPGETCPEGLLPVLPGSDALDLRSAFSDDVRLDLALAALDRLALLAFAGDTRTFSMHRLVQLAARGVVDQAAAWGEYAVQAALAAFPRPELATWPLCERLLPHALAALNALPNDADQLPAADLARRCASYLWARGEYAASEQMCVRALAIVENAFDPEDPAVTRGLNNLAVLYMELGRFEEAQPLLARALAIREKTQGPDHLDVALTLGNLAIVLMETERYAEAESLHRRALAIREKALHPNDPSVLVSVHSLGVLHRVQGRYAEAESLLSRVVATREQALGPDHPDVALSLMHLADVYTASGRGAEAEPHYLRALDIWERAFGVFGTEHPDVAEGLNALGKLYGAQGRHDEAEPLLTRALAIRQNTLGADHLLTKASREALDALHAAWLQ